MQCIQVCVLKMFQEGKTKPRKLAALVKMDVKDGKGQVPSRKAMEKKTLL